MVEFHTSNLNLMDWVFCVFLLTDFGKVEKYWGTAGTLEDMKMTAATATLLKCQADKYTGLEDLWTGVVVQTCCLNGWCFITNTSFKSNLAS